MVVRCCEALPEDVDATLTEAYHGVFAANGGYSLESRSSLGEPLGIDVFFMLFLLAIYGRLRNVFTMTFSSI